MIYHIAETTSTNDLAREERYGHGDVICAERQTAGRGQRGHTWTSPEGVNLLFSVVLCPTFLPAGEQFLLSQAVALALVDTLGTCGIDARIKWTNDIYVGDMKICGILIENSFSANRIDRAIVGIGINVNQTEFRSDAPNPVSMAMLTGRTYDLGNLLGDVTRHIIETFDSYEAAPDDDDLSRRYHARLWRRHGLHRWHDALTGEDITAAMRDVALTGHLTLDTDPPRTYAFKEISAIL